MTLGGRTCVVTGASSGIGRAVALGLVAAGANVWAIARRAEQLEETVALAGGPGSITSYPADLSVDAELESLSRAVSDTVGGVDVLIHAAGAYARGSLSSAPVSELDEQYRINLRAPYLLTQLLLPALRVARGQIVFINSTVVFGTGEGVGQYAATRHALRSLADTLRQEINDDGIRVASVYPGRTATPLQARIHELENKRYDPDRLLQAADIADVVMTILTAPDAVEITDVRVRPARKS